MKYLNLLRIQILMVCAVLVVACGCSNKPKWKERCLPTTDVERSNVAAMVKSILAATPASLAGHDQDWDDAIRAAECTSTRALCRPTYWEYLDGISADWEYTGRWRYADDKPTVACQRRED